MNLHNLRPAEGSTHKEKRIARGEGSRGGTATRGNKGAQARAGYHSKRGFEGGQMPFHKRIPKYGFTNINRVEFHGVNLDVIQELAAKDSVNKVDKAMLVHHGVASKNDLVKVLGRGAEKYSAALEITADAFSESAKVAIEKKGKAIIAPRHVKKEEVKAEAAPKAAKAPKAPKAEKAAPKAKKTETKKKSK
jgi:large subunit ribosomal protein L15